ncbi:hypothetical protein GLOIN_2v1703549, partial [Rhizophagus irregularis DAOM 181602=DAOM 197198]
VNFLLENFLKKTTSHHSIKMQKLTGKNKTWLRKIGDSNTSNLWRHLERNHPDKNPKKAKNLIIESQSTLDEFVGHTTFPSKPFTTLENKYFRQMIKVLNSDALVLSADTIKNDILESFNLGYYEDNKWKQSFIRYAKETVLNAYNNNYAPVTNVEVNDNNDEDNEFLDHIFGKKQNLQQNEVELYLKTPRADRNQDVLLWWMVII